MIKKHLHFGIMFGLICIICVQFSCDRRESGAAQKNEEKFFALTHFLNENIDEGIVFVSMDGMIQEANQKYLDLIGYPLEEARQLTYEQITPEKWHAMENDLRINQVMKRGFCDVYEKEYIRMDDSLVSIMTQAWLIKDEAGNPWRLMGIIRQID